MVNTITIGTEDGAAQKDSQTSTPTPAPQIKRPGPKSKTMGPAAEIFWKNHIGEVLESVSTKPLPDSVQERRSSILPNVPNAGPEVCSLCFVPTQTTTEDSKHVRKIARNLCRVMTSKERNEDVPSEILRDVYKFCGDCMTVVEQLWDAEEAIRKAKVEKIQKILAIEKKVLDAGEQVGSSKLRKFIIERTCKIPLRH